MNPYQREEDVHGERKKNKTIPEINSIHFDRINYYFDKCELDGARTPPNEDCTGYFHVQEGKIKLLVNFIADGHGGNQSSIVINKNLERIFNETISEHTLELDKMNDFMVDVITSVNIKLIELTSKCIFGGTTLTFIVTLLSKLEEIDHTKQRSWAFVLGDSQYMITHNGEILKNCVNREYDIQTKIYTDFNRDAVSIIQGVSGSFESKKSLPTRPLCFEDIEEYGITMKNGTPYQVKEVILHNLVFNKKLLPDGPYMNLACGNKIQCLRSLEPSSYKTIQKGVIDFIHVDRKYIDSLKIITFCDGFVDNNCLAENDIASLLKRETFLEFITDINFFRDTMFYKRIFSKEFYKEKMMKIFEIDLDDPRFIKDYDPIEFIHWLDELYKQAFTIIRVFDSDWKTSINAALDHLKIRIVEIIEGDEPLLEDVAYIASLRGSADNISGTCVSLRIN